MCGGERGDGGEANGSRRLRAAAARELRWCGANLFGFSGLMFLAATYGAQAEH